MFSSLARNRPQPRRFTPPRKLGEDSGSEYSDSEYSDSDYSYSDSESDGYVNGQDPEENEYLRNVRVSFLVGSSAQGDISFDPGGGSSEAAARQVRGVGGRAGGGRRLHQPRRREWPPPRNCIKTEKQVTATKIFPYLCLICLTKGLKTWQLRSRPHLKGHPRNTK